MSRQRVATISVALLLVASTGIAIFARSGYATPAIPERVDAALRDATLGDKEGDSAGHDTDGTRENETGGSPPVHAGETNPPEVHRLRTRSIEIPVETMSAGAAAIDGLTLWVTRDGGVTWSAVPGVHPSSAPIRYDAPDDGSYGFKVVARDRAGRAQQPPQPGDASDVACFIDTTPPHLAIISPASGAQVYAGSEIVVRWSTSDALLAAEPVTIEARRSENHPWSSILDGEKFPAEGAVQWWPPYVTGTFELRVTSEDEVGNRRIWVTPRPLQVVPFDSFRESEVLAAETTTSFRDFPVFYRSPKFRADELSTAEIWVRRGFGRWQVRTDLDRRSPYHFRSEEEGEVELYLRTINRNGLADRPAPGPDTPADLRVLVDTLPPLVSLRIEDGTAVRVHPGGEPLRIYWTLEEADPFPRGARIEVSIDGVRWQVLEELTNLEAGEGMVEWIPPLIETDDLDLRIVARDRAGNRAVKLAPTRVRLLNPLADPTDLIAKHHERALVLAARGDRRSLSRAIDELTLVLEISPEDSSAWHDRGVIETRLGRHAEASTSYRRALDLRPGDPRLSFSVVQGLINQHRADPEPDGTHLGAARRVFATIEKSKLFEDLEFRELLERYEILETALEPPSVPLLGRPRTSN